MLIIIEGCDGTGKTTLANQLSRELKAAQIHFGAELASNTKIFNLVNALVESSKTKNIVIDRFIHGQFIYQKPNERVLDYPSLITLERKIQASTQTILFLVEASPETVLKRLYKRGESIDGFDPSKLMRSYRSFFDTVSTFQPIIVKGE